MRTIPSPLASLAGLLVGLWLLVPLGLGVAVLAGHLLSRLVRRRWDRRHPKQAAVRQHTRQARRMAAEWPLLTQTLGLGYRDQWTRQHRFPTGEFQIDDEGVAATVAAIAGPAWPTTSAPLGTWPTPGAASRSGPSNRDRA